MIHKVSVRFTYINIGIVVAYVSIINIRYNWKRTLLSVITNNTTVIERSFYMPENKLENFVFTVIMAFLMVYAMICYNIALNIGGIVAGCHYSGNVHNGKAGYDTYKPRCHRGDAILFHAAGALRPDRLSDVPCNESGRDFPVQGIP